MATERTLAALDRLMITSTVREGQPCSKPMTAAAANYLSQLIDPTGIAGVGTAATGVTATEYGDGIQNFTKLILGGKTGGFAVGAIAGGADLAVGGLIYTFPAGDIVVLACRTVDLTMTEDDGNVTADDPDVGVGTTIGSGAVAVLGGTAAFENILTGQTSVNLAVTDVAVQTTLAITGAGAHTVYLNVADGWAASGEDDMSATGSIYIQWLRLSAS